MTAEVLRQRLVVVVASEEIEHLLFVTSNGAPLTTNNVRRRLRSVMAEAGILDRASGAAAEMLGHTSSKITREHYIEPDGKVNPVTAEILESLAPRANDSE